MASSSFRQGDEIQVGACRIFMINDGELDRAAASPPRDDVTRVQPPAVHRPRPKPAPSIKRGSWRKSRRRLVRRRTTVATRSMTSTRPPAQEQAAAEGA